MACGPPIGMKIRSSRRYDQPGVDGKRRLHSVACSPGNGVNECNRHHCARRIELRLRDGFQRRHVGHETVLYSFSGTDGAYPYAGLVRDAKGNFYGTTLEGGAFGWGTVFKLTSTGKKTLLHSFRGGKDGATPTTSVVLEGKGNLYGTTQHGGSLTCNGGNGCGIVFKLDARGKETVLHTFCLKNCRDGKDPSAGLVIGATGNFHSTTFEGGTTGCDANNGCGTVFEISHTGKETLLHRFTGTDGAYPLAGLVVDGTDHFYGTTAGGAEGGCIGYFGCGDLFEIVP